MDKKLFPDNWIYVHDPKVKMARITNYNNFITRLGKNKSAISVEYFTFKTDDVWQLEDYQLIKLTIKELESTGFLESKDVLDGFVIREENSYPTYYTGHKKHFNMIKNYITNFTNVQLIGRGGLYKYNNMDHSIFSGMLAARNYLMKKNIYNIWNINEDAEYLEK